MSAADMRQRALAWHTDVRSDAIARGLLERREWDAIEAARETSDGFKLRYLTDRGLTVEGLCDAARSHAAQGPLDLLVVDYLDLVRRPRSKRDDLEIGRVVRGLLEIAGELETHVLLLAQLNREGAGKPQLHHLAGSDEVARAAHHILLVERPETTADVFSHLPKADSFDSLANIKILVTTRSRGIRDDVEATLDLATSRLDGGLESRHA